MLHGRFELSTFRLHTIVINYETDALPTELVKLFYMKSVHTLYYDEGYEIVYCQISIKWWVIVFVG